MAGRRFGSRHAANMRLRVVAELREAERVVRLGQRQVYRLPQILGRARTACRTNVVGGHGGLHARDVLDLNCLIRLSGADSPDVLAIHEIVLTMLARLGD